MLSKVGFSWKLVESRVIRLVVYCVLSTHCALHKRNPVHTLAQLFLKHNANYGRRLILLYNVVFHFLVRLQKDKSMLAQLLLKAFSRLPSSSSLPLTAYSTTQTVSCVGFACRLDKDSGGGAVCTAMNTMCGEILKGRGTLVRFDSLMVLFIF